MGYIKSDDLARHAGFRAAVANRERRVHLRLDAALHDRVSLAARFEHRSLSEFFRVAAMERADRTLAEVAEVAEGRRTAPRGT